MKNVGSGSVTITNVSTVGVFRQSELPSWSCATGYLLITATGRARGDGLVGFSSGRRPTSQPWFDAGGRRGSDQTGFVGLNDGVDAVAQVHLHQHRRHVRFHGVFPDVQSDEFTEANLNPGAGSDLAAAFLGTTYKIMLVANKLQTGFDQPLRSAM